MFVCRLGYKLSFTYFSQSLLPIFSSSTSPSSVASKIHLHPLHTTYTYHIPITTTDQTVDNMNTKEIIFTLVLVVLSIFLVVVLVALYRDCSSLVCIRPSPSRNNSNNANQIRLSLSSSARERKKRNRARMTRSSLWMRISRRICLQPWRKVRSGLSIPSRLL